MNTRKRNKNNQFDNHDNDKEWVGCKSSSTVKVSYAFLGIHSHNLQFSFPKIF